MTVIDQEHLAPREDTRPYAGKWIAIREGRIIAVADDSVTLLADPEVGPDDQLIPVPSSETGIYVL
jgi:Family of unknown function (DUF5678)